MKIYFAHSFGNTAPAKTLRNNTDPRLTIFLKKLDDNGIVVVDPAEVPIPVNQPGARFAYCLKEIQCSDVLIVDASSQLGVGVGAEMMFASTRNLRVLVICPADSYYRTRFCPSETELIHPFILGLSSKIFLSFDECAAELHLL